MSHVSSRYMHVLYNATSRKHVLRFTVQDITQLSYLQYFLIVLLFNLHNII